jgi:DNA-binding response OmpR family regulator
MALRRNKKQEEPVRRGPARVLVVHDEPDGCELLVRLLDRAGHETDRASDFLEMSDKLLVPRPADCVVLDVAEGGIGGNLKLLDAIRGHHEPVVAAMRVVLVSATASNAIFSWQAGIDEFVVRPFHADQLVDAVGSAIRRLDEERPRYRRRRLDAVGAH